MAIKSKIVAGLLTLAVAGRLAAQETAEEPMQKAKTFEGKIVREVKLDYLAFLPRGYKADGAKKWPMIFFLHGAGERGTDVWKVAVHGPPKIVKEKKDFPFVVISPQCPDGKTWDTDSLVALLDDVMGKYQIDKSRIYLTGLSMGGYGSWNLGIAHPERFAAMAPICGGGQTIGVKLVSRENGPALKSLGVWAFHGAKDPTVPLEESERMVEELKKAGCEDVQLTVYPEATHNSWTETYNNPRLYEWFLEHERK